MSSKKEDRLSLKKVKRLVREFLDTSNQADASNIDIKGMLAQDKQNKEEQTGNLPKYDAQKAKASLKSIHSQLQPKGALSGATLQKVQKAFKKSNL